MDDQARTNSELVHEIFVLKQKIKEPEQSDSSLKRAEEALQKTIALMEKIDNTIPQWPIE